MSTSTIFPDIGQRVDEPLCGDDMSTCGSLSGWRDSVAHLAHNGEVTGSTDMFFMFGPRRFGIGLYSYKYSNLK